MTISTFAPDFDYNDVSKTLGVDKIDVLSASFEAVDGTTPFTVTSTTKVTNLNADKIDGLDSTAFLKVSNNLSDIANAGTARTNIGLGNVDNTADTAKPVSTAAQAALDLKAPLASPTFTGTVTGVTKAMVGLGSVDNTSDAAKPVSTAAQAALDLKAPLASPTFTGTVTVPTPVNSTDSSTKGYVDAVKQGLDIKDSVRVASTANISIATELINASVIDGVTVSTGDRVLLKNQSAPAENGIYVVVASGAASRSLDADVSADVTSGMYVFVSQGTANAGTGFVLITADPIVLGTTPISFTAFSGAGQVIAGNGLSESGNTLSIDTAVTADLSTAQTFTNKSISGGQITSAVANATLAATVTTNANLTGDVTSVGNATTLTNAPVISKVLTGYTSGAGTVAATDTILQAFQKINGNDALRETSSNKDASGGYAGLTLLKLNLRNAANTITNFFTTAATVARTWTMPDKDGTVSMISDITGANLTGTVGSAQISGAYSGITGVGTLTALAVDNINADLNTISTTSGALNLTPLSGQNLNVALGTTGDLVVNTNQFVVDTSAGNVGIGTASPTAKLQVDGDLHLGDAIRTGYGISTGDIYIELGGARSGDGNSYLDFHSQSGSDYDLRIIRNSGANGESFIQHAGTGAFSLITTGAADINLDTNATTRLSIKSSGNVGIGTTTPQVKTHVAVQAGPLVEAIRVQGYWNTLGDGPLIRFTNGIASGGAVPNVGEYNLAGIAALDADSWGGLLAFFTAPTGTSGGSALSERMRINSAGNVGIGTTSPENTLHVAGSASTLFRLASSSSSVFLRLENSVGSSAYIGTLGNDISLQTNATERVRINSAGNVGIGTTAPGYALDVNGNAAFGSNLTSGVANAWVYLRGTGLSSAGISYGSYGGFILNANQNFTSSARRFLITNALDTNKFSIIRSTDALTDPALGDAGVVTSGTADFTITDTGNVGIGTTSPASKLSVSGDIDVVTTSNFMYTNNIGVVSSAANLTIDASTASTIFKNSSAERMRIDVSGNVGIGTAAPNANAILDVASTTKAFMPPRMTTTQKNAIASPTAGMMVYDSTLNKLSLYTTAWETVTSI